MSVLRRGCEACGKQGPFKELHLDHATPPHRGGHSTLSNMRCLCSACNVRKGMLTWDEFCFVVRPGCARKEPPVTQYVALQSEQPSLFG